MQRTKATIKDVSLIVEDDFAKRLTLFSMRTIVEIEADKWRLEKGLVVQHASSIPITDTHIRDEILRLLIKKTIAAIEKEQDAIEQRLQGIHSPEQVRTVLTGENPAREVARNLREVPHPYDKLPAGSLKGYLEDSYFGGVRPTYGSGSGTFNAGHDDGWAGTITG